jgi:hypothetical protein
MQCLKGCDEKCGGTADRLKAFLFLLREAYLSQRLLFIHWTLPARLEEFLLPPLNSIDWRVPDWFSKILHNRARYPGRYMFQFKSMKSARSDNATILMRTRLQSITGGAELYDAELIPGEPSFAELYHDVWRIFFTPSPPVRSVIESYMEKWKLVPGEYAAAHLRALYGRVTNRSDELATEWAENAMNCASNLRPGGPFFFASDHTFSTEAAVAYGTSKHVRVVARNHVVPPLHLDNADNILDRKPSDFHTVFVDLYFMGMSRCLTYNRGGFGHWALLIGYNSSCFHNQKTSSAGIGAPCLWTAFENTGTRNDSAPPTAPLFISPVADHDITLGKTMLTNFSNQPLPVWMTDYFEWHRMTRDQLTKANWRETKYLVMSCKRHSNNCGGISDRLKTLPFVVLQAARHQRLLFIEWTRPMPLEEFLLPPIGGVDWRMPSFLRRFFWNVDADTSYGPDDLNRKMYLKSEDVLIYSRLQSPDAGEELYTRQPDSFSTYEDVFHALFRTFFVPVPRLQAIIDEKMKEHELAPNQYVAVHLRNMYGNRIWRNPNETISIVVNGINCASNIYPGAPIFFAADDKFAVDAAREYGRQRNIQVGSLDFQDDPIHLDKDNDWKNRSAADYDGTFLDLYMLGEARCVAYSNGGYGSFGSLLSYNSSCNIRYFRRRHIHQNCTYTDGHRQEIFLDPPVMNIPMEMYVDPRQKRKRT